MGAFVFVTHARYNCSIDMQYLKVRRNNTNNKVLVSTSLFLVRILLFFFFPSFIFAQTATSTVTSNKEVQLQKELDGINQEINGLNNTITGLKGEGVGLNRDIKLLNTNINKASLNIRAKNIQISRLGDGIADKSRTVDNLTTRMARERQSLAQLVRKTNELDQASLAEMLLSDEDLSSFFLDLDSFDAIRAGLKNSADSLRSAKAENETARQALEARQNQESDVKAELERNKRLVQSNEVEKKRLLSITKNKESEYGKVLVDRKKRATEIRAALFALRDSGEIKFGQALDYANVVSAKTGVRPAFLLAIFMQESGFGKNVGSCFLKDVSTGSGVGSRSGTVFPKVMNPTRDVPRFMNITKKLGRDPFDTLVSCPQEVGWGGAMGAAQFIPSTWALYENLITNALGIDVADPWHARDAFMAAGFLLKDNGAKSGSYSAERDAACKYFSGRKCSQSSWAATYGNQVMAKASNIQETMIDQLQNP